jgi:hypothetical protein
MKIKNLNLYLGLLLATFAIIMTEPSLMASLPFTIYGSVVAVINVVSFWYIGFVVVIVITDSYLDKNFGLDDFLDEEIDAGVLSRQVGLMGIARSIVILAFSFSYSVLVFIFFGG